MFGMKNALCKFYLLLFAKTPVYFAKNKLCASVHILLTFWYLSSYTTFTRALNIHRIRKNNTKIVPWSPFNLSVLCRNDAISSNPKQLFSKLE